MLQKVITSFNGDSGEFTVDLHDQLNPFVAAALIDAAVSKSAVYADAGGVIHVVLNLGGDAVKSKLAELEKDDSKDDKGQPVEDGKTPQQKVDEAVAASQKKEAEDKAKVKAALPPPPPPPPPVVEASGLSHAGAATTMVVVPEKADKGADKPPTKSAAKPEDEEDGEGRKAPAGKPLHSPAPGRR